MCTKKDRGWFGSSGSRRPVTVYVTTPILAGAAIGGSGDMRIDAVEGGSFSASIGGSGDMDIASLRVRSADFSIEIGRAHVRTPFTNAYHVCRLFPDKKTN